MGAQLNIKDAATVELARDLARKLGKTVTEIVREALEEKARAREKEIEGKIARMNAIVDAFQQNLPAEWKGKASDRIMDELYDRDGVPQ